MTPEQRERFNEIVRNLEDDGCSTLLAFVSSLTVQPWTSEAPTTKGRYRLTLVVDVFPGLFGKLYWQDIGKLCSARVSATKGQWSGPIPEPGEE